MEDLVFIQVLVSLFRLLTSDVPAWCKHSVLAWRMGKKPWNGVLVGGLMRILNIYIMKLLDKIDEVHLREINEKLRNKFRADWLQKTVEIDVGSSNTITDNRGLSQKHIIQISQVSRCFQRF